MLFRVGGVALLIFLDVCGLALGCTPRWRCESSSTARADPLGVIWREAEASGCRFSRSSWCSSSGRRGCTPSASSAAASGKSSRRSPSSPLLTLAFGIGTGLPLLDLRHLPDGARVHRASDRPLPRELRRRHAGPLPLTGLSRRAVLVGEGEHLVRLHRTSAPAEAASSTSCSGVRHERGSRAAAPRLGSADSLRAVARRATGRRADRHRLRLRAAQLLRSSTRLTARASQVRIAPKTTELLDAARRVRPRAGRAALRAPAAGVRRHRLGRQARFDIIVSLLVLIIGLPLWLADRAARSSSRPAARSSTATGASGSGSASSGC